MQPQTTTKRRLAIRLGAAGALLAALLAPAHAAGRPGGTDVLTAAQSPEGDGSTTSTSLDGTTTSTSVDGSTTTSLDGTSTTTTVAESPPGDDGMPADGGTGEDPPGHGEDDPGHADPTDSFPDDWTPEQVAFAQKLIDDTEAALERYRNPGILPLLGYTWILDGTQPDGYQHWVNLGWFGDGHRLDPAYPESLVFRNSEDGPVLEAAMYLLPWGYNLSNIPEDVAWLPGWHVHDNL
ncbi:MAG TPA: hypothetical protein VF015_00895, partial [Acidimicrobiales bacterium]